jgi:manganese-dependent inorganic pyrophosphatase
MIKVFGHKTPDTDSVCSSIVYAWYLKNKKNIEAQACILGDINKETEFVLQKFQVEKPQILESLHSEDEVVIVDTNNPEELLEGINEAKLKEVIDHHKLSGGLTTSEPIKVTIRPLACTATILWQMFQSEENSDIPKEMAGLFVSAIISDTLNFSSPTTTEDDKKAVEELAKIAEIDVNKHAEEMFSAKSDLSGMSAKDVLMSDSKLFDMKGKKVRVGVLETTKPENALAMKDEILNEMENVKNEESLDAHFFFVVDILNSSSEVIVAGEFEKEIIEKAYNCKVENSQAHLDGTVSRKKQMIPNIEKAIE